MCGETILIESVEQLVKTQHHARLRPGDRNPLGGPKPKSESALAPSQGHQNLPARFVSQDNYDGRGGG